MRKWGFWQHRPWPLRGPPSRLHCLLTALRSQVRPALAGSGISCVCPISEVSARGSHWRKDQRGAVLSGPRAPGEAPCSLWSSEWGRCLAVFLHPSPGSPPALQPSLTTVGLPGPFSPTTPRLGCLGGPLITGCFESWAQACFPELESSGSEVI